MRLTLVVAFFLAGAAVWIWYQLASRKFGKRRELRRVIAEPCRPQFATDAEFPPGLVDGAKSVLAPERVPTQAEGAMDVLRESTTKLKNSAAIDRELIHKEGCAKTQVGSLEVPAGTLDVLQEAESSESKTRACESPSPASRGLYLGQVMAGQKAGARPAEDAPPESRGRTRPEPVNVSESVVDQPRKDGLMVEPGKRGGRPRVPTRETQQESIKTSGERRLKPEIVCWKRDREWVVAVELPSDLTKKPGYIIIQDGNALVEDEAEKGCWRLACLNGEIIVRCSEAENEDLLKIALGNADYLVFKLTGGSLNRGRRVKQPTYGSYLVVVPENWTRNEEQAGPPTVVPEPTCLDGYRAHFFDLPENSPCAIAFRDDKGCEVVIGSCGPQFQLVGEELHDAAEHVGPLFGGTPPRIRITNGSWENVGTMVLGEEGRGRRRWRTEFKPDPALHEQEMPSDVVARKAGWYFVRFYDLRGELIDSLDFRFCLGLRRIKIHPVAVVPPSTGHGVATVEFEHDADWRVTPSLAKSVKVEVSRAAEKTVVKVPPHPEFDRTEWFLETQGGSRVAITILIERIWWAVGDENSQPTLWIDKQITLTRDDLLATSSKVLWVRLPKCRWTESIHVGFEQGPTRRYKVLAGKNTVAIPLRDFGDAPQINRVGANMLYLSANGALGAPCIVEVRAGCKFCDFVASTIEDAYLHVRGKHLRNFFRDVTYDELRNRLPSLPVQIYRCAYCPAYVRADNPENPTSAIVRHVENCSAAPRGGGSAMVSFHVISDVDEIRQNVIAGLPRIQRCKLCNSDFDENSDDLMWDHLIQNHTNDLYTLL